MPEHQPSPARQQRMPFIPALQVLAGLRTDQVVVTTMGSAREWPKLSQHPLDLHYIPSAMGQAPALGLGIAIAQPDREVIVLNGDGCQLMNLGVLVTIIASRAKNLTLIVLDNGIYEVTGGQQTAAATTERGTIDFAGMARAAGFKSVRSFSNLNDWQREAASVLKLPGPRFVALAVEPVGASFQLESPGPIAERLAKFQSALFVS